MAPSFTEELVRDPLGLFRHATGPKPFLPLGGGPECGPRLQRDTSQAPLLRVSSGQVWPMAGGGGSPLKEAEVRAPLPEGTAGPPPPPRTSFHLPPSTRSLLWNAEVFGLLVCSEVPQTSSSISGPVTSDYDELEASSLTGRLGLSLSIFSEHRENDLL